MMDLGSHPQDQGQDVRCGIICLHIPNFGFSPEMQVPLQVIAFGAWGLFLSICTRPASMGGRIMGGQSRAEDFGFRMVWRANL